MQQIARVIKAPANQAYFIALIKEAGLWIEKAISSMDISNDLLNLLDKDTIEMYQIMPICVENERIILATNLASNLNEASMFEELTSKKVKIKICSLENIKEGIRKHYELSTNTFDALERQDEDDAESDKTGMTEEERSKLFNRAENIILAAYHRGASDIHFKPSEKGMIILFRIDGILLDYTDDFARDISENQKEYLINIIKAYCPTMDASDRLTPQDGDFRWKINQNWVDFRGSTIKALYGQKAVIRLLDSNKVPLDLDELGFSQEEKNLIMRIVMISSGLFFVTGPVGSGKSTTIHAALKPFKSHAHNTVTIENPCEYKDELLTQVQVHKAKDKSKSIDGRVIFKALLRQDPETIFFGETRDAEDAAMLVTASLSGHRILTTLHATDAVSAMDRLFNMGVDRSAIKQINGILAQRLLTKNCPHCRVPYEFSDLEKMILSQEDLEFIMSGKPMQSIGCDQCNKGFKGRQVVAEIIPFTNEFRDYLTLDQRGIKDITTYLQEKMGFESIWKKALRLVHSGDVRLSELLRVFPPEL